MLYYKFPSPFIQLDEKIFAKKLWAEGELMKHELHAKWTTLQCGKNYLLFQWKRENLAPHNSQQIKNCEQMVMSVR